MAVAAPQGVCLGVKHLRKRGYSDLRAWMQEPGHVNVTRGGRVFIKDDDGVSRPFHYPRSPWCNAFRVQDHGREACLAMFREHLRALLQRDADARARFLLLASATEIGCYCAPEEACHRDVILEELTALLLQQQQHV